MDKLWVCGGASGIGNHIAHDAKNDWDMDVRVTGKDVDVRDWDAVDAYVFRNAPFDHIVYSAGIASLDWISTIDDNMVHDVFNVNVMGFIGMMRALVRHQPRGNIVAIVSDAAHNPMRGSMAYCASKAALEMAVRVAARELAPNWRINGVSPCVVDGTEMTKWIDENVPQFRGWDPERYHAYEEAQIPMGRRCTMDEVSQQVMQMLVGPAFMTGSIIPLTGGK